MEVSSDGLTSIFTENSLPDRILRNPEPLPFEGFVCKGHTGNANTGLPEDEFLFWRKESVHPQVLLHFRSMRRAFPSFYETAYRILQIKLLSLYTSQSVISTSFFAVLVKKRRQKQKQGHRAAIHNAGTQN